MMTARRPWFVVTLALVTLLHLAGLVGATVAAARVSEALWIRADTVLREDHRGNIFIAADGVTLDCNGHSVTGPGFYQGIYLAGFDDVTIIGCRVSGFGNGIAVVHGADRARIEGNETWGNQNAGIAAGDNASRPGSGLIITANRSWNNGGNGIQVVNAIGASVVGNSVDGNRDHGIGVARFHGGLIADNTSTANANGLWLARSTTTVVRDNVMSRNTMNVWLNGSDHNVIEGNLVTDGHAGVFLTGSSWNEVRDNRAVRHTALGLGATEGSIWDPRASADHNLFEGNVSIANDPGITIYGGRGNVVARNRLSRSVGDGLIVVQADRTTVVGNLVLHGDAEGMSLREATDGTIVRNRFLRNAAFGMSIEGSTGNVFRANVACANRTGNISDDQPAANTWVGVVVCSG